MHASCTDRAIRQQDTFARLPPPPCSDEGFRSLETLSSFPSAVLRSTFGFGDCFPAGEVVRSRLETVLWPRPVIIAEAV